MSRNIIYFGGKSLADFGMYNNGRSTYNAPAKDYEMVKLLGRSGDLAYYNNRFNNYELTYPDCWVYDNFEENIENLRGYLMSRVGYQRLEDTYHPNEYRMAICKNALDISVDMWNAFGMFNLVFECKPQRFLKSGEVVQRFEEASTIENPTYFPSRPLIKVHGYGNVGIGSKTITINSDYGSTDIFIDCEMMESYIITGNAMQTKNDKVIFSDYNFPTIGSGTVPITMADTIEYVEITPRWWTI